MAAATVADCLINVLRSLVILLVLGWFNYNNFIASCPFSFQNYKCVKYSPIDSLPGRQIFQTSKVALLQLIASFKWLAHDKTMQQPSFMADQSICCKAPFLQAKYKSPIQPISPLPDAKLSHYW
jgi:hypothetical protein